MNFGIFGLLHRPQLQPSPRPDLTNPLTATRPIATLAQPAPSGAEQDPIVNKLESVFGHVKNWFGKVFKNAPSASVIALSALNAVAPEVEIALAFIDPAAAPIADAIITEVQADLGTVAILLKQGNTANVPTFVAAIKDNFAALLAGGHIKDAASQAKAKGIFDAIAGVLDNIVEQLHQAQQ